MREGTDTYTHTRIHIHVNMHVCTRHTANSLEAVDHLNLYNIIHIHIYMYMHASYICTYTHEGMCVHCLPEPRPTAERLLPICPGFTPTAEVLPIPSCPASFLPQQTTPPPTSRAHVCESPRATATAGPPAVGPKRSRRRAAHWADYRDHEHPQPHPLARPVIMNSLPPPQAPCTSLPLPLSRTSPTRDHDPHS
jgi:hypothetical protein